MNGRESRDTVDLVFRPTIKLLGHYRRVATSDEYGDVQNRLNELAHDLHRAYRSGDIYESWILRQELRQVCRKINETIATRQAELRNKRLAEFLSDDLVPSEY